MIKQYAFNSDTAFIKRINSFIDKHKSKYRNRTQFIIQAIEEKLEREDFEDAD